MSGRRWHSALRWVGLSAAFLVAVALVGILFEGAASTLLALRDIASEWEPPMMERRHAVYDARIGWVNEPNLRIPDMYGPGKDFSTNGQGFRGVEDVGRVVPAGQRRVICSGDSFTLGHGVADADTWCKQLERWDDQLETVNMGQGGYGIDQAYLWYERDGFPLDHDVHVFAFIQDDFRRMQGDEFMGHAKPVLRLRNDSLTVENVPVPRRRRLWGAGPAAWLARNGRLAAKFRSIEFLERLVTKFRAAVLDVEPPAVREVTQDSLATRIALHVFAELAAMNESKGSQLILVFLPARWDYATGISDRLRETVKTWAESRTDLVYLDLVEDLRELPATAVPPLFIPEGEIGSPHLSEAGNAWVADLVFQAFPPREP